MRNAKKFDILTICLSVLVYNYFDDLTKLFSDLYLTKFLGILTKSFFPYRQVIFPDRSMVVILKCIEN